MTAVARCSAASVAINSTSISAMTPSTSETDAITCVKTVKDGRRLFRTCRQSCRSMAGIRLQALNGSESSEEKGKAIPGIGPTSVSDVGVMGVGRP